MTAVAATMAGREVRSEVLQIIVGLRLTEDAE
jgi:hypothetical protein